MIIDIHMHLGNIFRENGGATIYQNIKYPRHFNIQRFEEDVLKFNIRSCFQNYFKVHDDEYTLSVQERASAGTADNYVNLHYKTLQKLSKHFFGDDKVFCACMPISPYVNFDDIYEYSMRNKTIIPFTSINPLDSVDDISKKISEESKLCAGLKLHPILQGIAFNSGKTYAALDVFRPVGKPVLFHAGASRYYIGDEAYKQHCELDSVTDAVAMISKYHDIPFIVGHTGIYEYEEWSSALSRFENVYCDISVQSSAHISEILNTWGEDRVLFGTDFPCCRTKSVIKIVAKAIPKRVCEKIFYANATNILGLSI